jgi:peroxiredoxin
MKFLSAIMALMLLIPTASHAQTKEPMLSMPSNLELMDETGTKRSFADLTGKKGLVLVFHRSAAWCPFCKMQLIDMNAQRAMIEDKGYNIAAISYDSVEALKKFDTRYKVEFPLLSDEDSKTIRAFGIFNEKNEEGSRAYGVPHPTIFVVSADKVITATIAEEGYRKRPAVEVIVEALK